MPLPKRILALERASSPFSPILWAILGLAVALTIQTTQAQSLGGWSGLLAVGKESELRPLLVQQLKSVVLVEKDGHDGHVTYVVGLDPSAEWAYEVIPNAAYRYRRILLPALASGFGLIDGQPLMWTLTLLNAAAFAGATATAALIARTRSMHRWAPLAVLMNVGLWLSLHVTSVDLFAFALAVAGIAAHFKGRHVLSVALFALSVLSKEMYLLVPLALAAHLWLIKHETRLALSYSMSLVPLAIWNGFLIIRLPRPFETGGNLSWPLFGILEGAQSWVRNDAREIGLLVLTGVALTASVVLVIKSRQRIWAWIASGWLLLAAVSAHWVWDLGNNAARAFLPLATFVCLGFLDRRTESHSVMATTA